MIELSFIRLIKYLLFVLFFLKDPNERNQTPPETNENEFCVMLTSNAAKDIEISIKKIFGRCDWLKIVEKCPIPTQVKMGMFSFERKWLL